MAWGYKSTAESQPETPDYSVADDYSEPPDYAEIADDEFVNQNDYSPEEKALQNDLAEAYRPTGFKDNLRDKHHETKKALDLAEKDSTSHYRPDNRNIGKQERKIANQPAWKTNLEAKQRAAMSKAKNHQTGFLAKNKNKAIVVLVGLVISGAMSIFMLPAIAVAEFGQIANWIKNTTQTVHDLATGARTMRNTIRSATVAARSAAASGIKSHFQMSRVGMFGEMTGRNFLSNLEKSGIKVQESLTGLYDGMELDYAKISGDGNLKPPTDPGPNASSDEKQRYQQAKEKFKTRLDAQIKNLGLEGIATSDPATGKIRLPDKMNYRDTLKALRAGNSVAGNSKFKIGREVKIRYTARMLGISSWLHPVEKLKGLSRDAIRSKVKALKEKKLGKTQAKGAFTPDSETTTDANGNTSTSETADSTNARSNESTLSSEAEKANQTNTKGKPRFKAGAMLKGGAAAILLIGLCAMVSAEDAFVENMLSLTTSMGSIYQTTTSTWGQVQSAFIGLDNEGIDMNVLAELHKDLYDDKIPEEYETDEAGYITSVSKYTSKSFAESPAYQATTNGKKVSSDRVPSGVATMYEENGGWGAAAMRTIGEIPVLGEIINYGGELLCNEITGWIMTALGGLNPLNLITTAAFLIPEVQDVMNEFIATVFQIGTGVLLDDSQLDPDQRAEVAYRASEYVVNTNFASEGAKGVSTSQAYENQLIAEEWLAADWQSRPLAERLFNASDYRSTIARVVNGARINTLPSNIGDHLANFAKLIGAVPSFISSGLVGRSTEAKAADAISYDTGAPKIQLSKEFLDKITGDEAWDFDVNAEKVFGLLGKSGTDTDFHKYASDCLGMEIGSGPDYKVTALESDNVDQALLVGLNGGTWSSNYCQDRTGEDYQRVALYAGLDYSILAGYAWYSADNDDPEAQKIAKELGFEESSSGSKDSGGNGDIVATATGGLDQLECQDCVAFVKSVYFKAGLPQPLAGSKLSKIAPAASCGDNSTIVGRTSIGDYAYCTGFSETSQPVPGDVAVWSGHVAIYLGNDKVSEGGGGDRSGADSNCNINGTPWRSLDDAVFLHYGGGK